MPGHMFLVFLVDLFDAAEELVDVEERSPPKKLHYFEVKDDGAVLNRWRLTFLKVMQFLKLQ